MSDRKGHTDSVGLSVQEGRKSITIRPPITIGFAGGDVNLYRYVGNNSNNFIDPSGLMQWGEAGKATLGLVANSIGVGVGVGLALIPEPVSTVVGGAVATKSTYGFVANAYNLKAACFDETPMSNGTLANDVAEGFFPGNENAQSIATALDLSADLATGRVSANAVKSGLGKLDKFSLERVSIADPTNVNDAAKAFMAADVVKTFWNTPSIRVEK